MKLVIAACLLAVCTAAPASQSSDSVDSEIPVVTVIGESDVRNDDGSSSWSYTLSDGTARQESNAQKQIGDHIGNINQGSVVYVSPDGQKISLTWVADENGFQPQGDHLPTPPPIPEEIQAAIASLPKHEE